MIPAAIGMSLTVSACASKNLPASLSGVCGVFTDPGFQVLGRYKRDQVWVSQTQESGIQSCGWKRPAKRVLPKPKQVVAKPAPAPVAKETPLPKPSPVKKSIIQRLKEKIHR